MTEARSRRTLSSALLFSAIALLAFFAVSHWTAHWKSPEAGEHQPMIVSISGPNTALSSENMDPMLQYVCDRFDIEFDFLPTGSYNASEIYRLQASLNSLPDILMCDARWDLNYFIRSGSLRPLPTSMGAYPHLNAFLSWPYGISVQYDSKLWGIPARLFDSSAGTVNTCAVFYKEAYDAAWPSDTPPASMEEWHTLLANLHELFPDSIPLTSRDPESMYDLSYFYCPTLYTWAWDEEKLDYLPGYYTDSFRESIAALKPLWDDGLLDPDFMNEGSGRPSGLDKFMLSDAIGMMYSCSPYIWQSEFVPAWLKTHPDTPFEESIQLVFLPGNAEGDYPEAFRLNMDTVFFGSSVSNEKLTRILSMLDWLCSDEGRIFRQHGLKGEDYIQTEVGTIEQLTSISALYGKYPSYSLLRTLPDQDTNALSRAGLQDASISFVIEQYNKWRETVNIQTHFNTSIRANTVSTPAVINFNPQILSNSFRMLTSDSIEAEFEAIQREYQANGIELMIISVNNAP